MWGYRRYNQFALRCIPTLLGLHQADDGPEAAVDGGANPREEPVSCTKELMRLSEALEEADALKVSVRSRDAALQAQVGLSDM